jgi:hypothetical protein
MSDNLTFNLGKHGYRAYKYVPYGEVKMVVSALFLGEMTDLVVSCTIFVMVLK